MTAKAFEIQVQDDHLARIAQTRKPISALAELIWNAVDADATCIDVTLINNDLDGLEAIEVTDNGHGIPYAQAEDLFSRLGGSLKQSRTHSNEENRILHGKEGRGRFRAFSFGRVVECDVRAADPSGALQRYRISMIADRLRRVEISAAAPATDGAGRGVTVTVSQPENEFRSLRNDTAVPDLAQTFALYLRQYPKVRIVYSGTALDPRSVEEVPPLSAPALQRAVAEVPETPRRLAGPRAGLARLLQVPANLAQQTTVPRQAEHIVHSPLLAPGHERVPTKTRVPAHHDRCLRPALPDAPHDPLQFHPPPRAGVS